MEDIGDRPLNQNLEALGYNSKYFMNNMGFQLVGFFLIPPCLILFYLLSRCINKSDSTNSTLNNEFDPASNFDPARVKAEEIEEIKEVEKESESNDKHCEEWIGRVYMKLRGYLFYNSIIMLVMLSYSNITICCLISFHDFSFNSSQAAFQSLTSLFFFITVLIGFPAILLGWYLKINLRSWKTDEPIVEAS